MECLSEVPQGLGPTISDILLAPGTAGTINARARGERSTAGRRSPPLSSQLMTHIQNIAELWQPSVLGRTPLNGRWWAYLVAAPFDMAACIPELLGTYVALDQEPCRVAGTIQKVPARDIEKGEPVLLLVRRLALNAPGHPPAG